MKNKFENRTEAGFYDYMLGQRRYKESTVWDYIKRIRKVEPMDTLINKNLGPFINDFENGAHETMNSTCHNAYSCALKRLQEYQKYRGIIVV